MIGSFEAFNPCFNPFNDLSFLGFFLFAKGDPVIPSKTQPI